MKGGAVVKLPKYGNILFVIQKEKKKNLRPLHNSDCVRREGGHEKKKFFSFGWPILAMLPSPGLIEAWGLGCFGVQSTTNLRPLHNNIISSINIR